MTLLSFPVGDLVWNLCSWDKETRGCSFGPVWGWRLRSASLSLVFLSLRSALVSESVKVHYVSSFFQGREGKMGGECSQTQAKVQRPRALVEYMVQYWNLENRVMGRDIGPERFFFRFETEADLQLVLKRAPYHFKKWMFILQRWEPVISDAFPALIPFWIRMHDIPMHHCTAQTLKTIGGHLGPLLNEDLPEGRIRVNINGLEPLEMSIPIRLPTGEVTSVQLEYEKLEKHCFLCFSLTHKEKDCPRRESAPHFRFTANRNDPKDSSRSDLRDRIRHRAVPSHGNRDHHREQSPRRWTRRESRRESPQHSRGLAGRSEGESQAYKPSQARGSSQRDHSQPDSQLVSSVHRNQHLPLGEDILGNRVEDQDTDSRPATQHFSSPTPHLALTGLDMGTRMVEETSNSRSRRPALERVALSNEDPAQLDNLTITALSEHLQDVDIQYMGDSGHSGLIHTHRDVGGCSHSGVTP
ncbi:unnamed protein product [Arabidopsis thaliana]|uniref:(thale cress) hypothetical protein n=1 Tax=Arabidopsis thaliana TaxID=3702 RepID=A0A7G2FG48_ARATH|nr:unnamed protein product [Arabidopsis thaliana]